MILGLADGFGRNEVLDIPPHGTPMRDQFLRKTETEMDMPPRGNTSTSTSILDIGVFTIFMKDLMPPFLSPIWEEMKVIMT